MRRRLIEVSLAAALVVLLATVGFSPGWSWREADRRVQSTDNAYVQGDLRTLGAKVPGHVRNVLVADFANVEEGQPLVQIDDDDYRARVAFAESVVRARQAAIANIDALTGQQHDLIDQAAAQIETTHASLDLARVQRDRARNLLRATFGTQAAFDEAEAAFRAAAATLRSNEAALARIDLDHTLIRAPVRGQLGRRAVLESQYVGAGAGVVTLTPLDTVWIAANFKETQLTRVRGGQPVAVGVDAFPGVAVTDTVDAVAPASGAATALLPPDDATGNFTRIVQRVPVKVTLDPGHALGGPLRPGMSAIVSIGTGTSGVATRQGIVARLLAALGLERRGVTQPRTLAAAT